jgi:hypothetical protein
MAKMDDESLLSLLNGKEQEAASYVNGQLAGEREKSMREYFREPYGNEEEGWSSIVTSEVQDTIEWILPSLLDIFTSTDEAVSFEPNREKDVKGAQQATDGCNYIFYKQNNGFLTLYTAFKDALMVKNCAVMWRKHEEEVPKTETYRGLTEDQLAYILQQGGEIIAASQQPAQGPDGQPVDDGFGNMVMLTDAKIKTVEKRNTVKVEAFPPENLLVQRNWHSPLLQDCPYVCRMMEVTLSDLREMGYDDIDDDDLSGDGGAPTSPDAEYRYNRTGQGRYDDLQNDDDSQKTGWLRIEFVLADRDGDGIAERLCIHRLDDKILSCEETSHVQIATASPILIAHRWDGLSLAEVVSDLQQLKTEITRQTLNSLYLANNPRTGVLTDSNGSPLANLDDLLDSRPGGIVRKRSVEAAQEMITPFVGAQSFPMLEYVDHMREQRTGVSKQQQGLDANALRNDRTAAEVQMTSNAAQQRIRLMARIFAEVLVKPVFQGILKLLTDGGMDQLAFKLRGEFVQMDPNEWRDQYDMTINVGLGTGDKDQQAGHLQMILQNQVNSMQMGLSSPAQIYNTLAKMTENAGFKNVGDFWTDPKNAPPKQPQVPPEVQAEQAKIQANGQIEQMKLQQKMQSEEAQRQADAQLEQLRMRMQAEVDNNRQAAEAQQHAAKMQNEAQLAALKAQYADQQHQRDMQFKRWQAELDASVRIEVANIGSKAKLENVATETATAEIGREVQP